MLPKAHYEYLVMPVHLCINLRAKAISELSSISIGRYMFPLRIEILQSQSCLHYINRTSKQDKIKVKSFFVLFSCMS